MARQINLRATLDADRAQAVFDALIAAGGTFAVAVGDEHPPVEQSEQPVEVAGRALETKPPMRTSPLVYHRRHPKGHDAIDVAASLRALNMSRAVVMHGTWAIGTPQHRLRQAIIRSATLARKREERANGA